MAEAQLPRLRGVRRDRGYLGEVGLWRRALFYHGVRYYFFFILLVMVLLLNLLIAMLSSTYEGVQKKATLEWRLGLARRVLRYELLGSLVRRDHGWHRLPAKRLRVGRRRFA